MQIALNVLRACTEHAEPRHDDIRLLKVRLGVEADQMAIDELARTIIERNLHAFRRTAKGGL